MLKGILGDADIKGQMRILTALMLSEPRREIWDGLGLDVFTFGDFQMPGNATDAKIWETCQRNGLVLITANRNQHGQTSLEETIRLHNKPDSLPVFTLSDPKRVKRSGPYANRVVEKLLDRLHLIDAYRGAGRLYLP
jgi:hypothetical protein